MWHAVALSEEHVEPEGLLLAELQREALLQPLMLGLAEGEREALTHPVGELETLGEALCVRETVLQPEDVMVVVVVLVPEEHTEAVPMRLMVETALVGMGEGLTVEQPLGERLALLAALALDSAVVGMEEREGVEGTEGDLEEEAHLEEVGQEEGERLPVEVLHSVTDTEPLREPVLLTEEQAFWVLEVLTNEILPPDYYHGGLVGVHADQRVLAHLVLEVFPDVADVLAEAGIETSVSSRAGRRLR